MVGDEHQREDDHVPDQAPVFSGTHLLAMIEDGEGHFDPGLTDPEGV